MFEALLTHADMLVHGYRPGALAQLGYSDSELSALNPGLINISLSAYGVTGPWGERRGFDSLVQMSTGIAEHGRSVFGGDKPVPLPVQALDHATGYLMAAAALYALKLRESGKVARARLSLARTAYELMQHKKPVDAPPLKPEPEDFIDEETPWGKARRLRFPLLIDGKAVVWRKPVGALRRDGAAWAITL